MVLSNNILSILDYISEKGGKPLIVGGFVRDMLIGFESTDVDIEVYNLSMEELSKVLEKIDKVSIQGNFGTIKLKNYENIEISIPRKETQIGVKHTDFMVNIDPFMSYKEACSRRDFTVNTLMYDYEKQLIIDEYGGLRDIKEMELRHVSDKFVEDPLRVLRAIRFVCKYNFKLNLKTYELCLAINDDLKYISKERISEEVDKIVRGRYFESNYEKFVIIIKPVIDIQEKYDPYFGEYSILVKLFIFLNSTNDSIYCLSSKRDERKLLIKMKNIIGSYTQISAEYIYEIGTKFKPSELMYLSIAVNHISKSMSVDSMITYHKYVNTNLSIYDGYYFLSRGIEPRNIKNIQKKLIIKNIKEEYATN